MGISASMLPGISSDNLPGVSSDILSGSFRYLSGVYSGDILTGISSGIALASGILF